MDGDEDGEPDGDDDADDDGDDDADDDGDDDADDDGDDEPDGDSEPDGDGSGFDLQPPRSAKANSVTSKTFRNFFISLNPFTAVFDLPKAQYRDFLN